MTKFAKDCVFLHAVLFFFAIFRPISAYLHVIVCIRDIETIFNAQKKMENKHESLLLYWTSPAAPPVRNERE